MVSGVVDSVHTNGVDAEFLEKGDVALATSYVGDGVLRVGRAAFLLSVSKMLSVVMHHTRLVVDTTDVETLVASEESCVC